MASWDKPRQQDDLEECPICLVKVTRRRKSNHLYKCIEAHKNNIDSMGLIICPLYPNHVMPKKYFNHHLDGNCDAANNMLRKYLESNKYNLDSVVVPVNFYTQLSSDVLNNHNRKLLYLLLRESNSLDNLMLKMEAEDEGPKVDCDID